MITENFANCLPTKVSPSCLSLQCPLSTICFCTELTVRKALLLSEHHRHIRPCPTFTELRIHLLQLYTLFWNKKLSKLKLHSIVLGT